MKRYPRKIGSEILMLLIQKKKILRLWINNNWVLNNVVQLAFILRILIYHTMHETLFHAPYKRLKWWKQVWIGYWVLQPMPYLFQSLPTVLLTKTVLIYYPNGFHIYFPMATVILLWYSVPGHYLLLRIISIYFGIAFKLCLASFGIRFLNMRAGCVGLSEHLW